jgi:uncharacterized protein
MRSEYFKLLQWSESNKKNLTKRIDRLKRLKTLDQTINSAHEKAFNEIDCLECANCCKTTGPLVTNSDISRISSKLRVSEREFVSTYLRTDEDGDHVFKGMPCPFLSENNYCAIYEYRPRACRQFPHTNQNGQAEITHLTRKNGRICPAVARIYQIISDLD